MRDPIAVVGLGQMGGTFAHGFLRRGRPVYPVTRAMDPYEVAEAMPAPALALIAVGEAELDGVLARMPITWRDRLALIQNELQPRDWQRHGIAEPTIAIVWFEKKRTTPVHVVLPTLVSGPRAQVIVEALDALAIPVREIDRSALLFELVRKNLYILTANIAGMEVGGTVSELWARHRDLASAVANEILTIEAWRAGQPLARDALLAGLVEAFEGDPNHLCTGRSAPARLERALARAREAGIDTPALERIASTCPR